MTDASTKPARMKAGAVRRAALACALGLCLPAWGGAVAAQQGQTPPDPPADGVQRPRAVNTTPLVALAETGKGLIEQGRLGLNTTFHLTADFEINQHGGFRPDTFKLTWRGEPDEGGRALGQAFATAVSQSRVLSTLRDEVRAVRITLELDRENVTLGLEGETGSAAAAQQLATGYGMMLKVGSMQKKGTPEGALYERLKFTSDGNLFKMAFAMPKAEAARAVADILARRAARQ
jgi:hypothetical protein